MPSPARRFIAAARRSETSPGREGGSSSAASHPALGLGPRAAWLDWDPEHAKRTRRAFMERYCDTDTLICTAHSPLPSAGRIVAQGAAFRFLFESARW